MSVMEALTPLQTPRLRLRGFRREDLASFRAYRDDPDVARYQSWSSYSATDAEAFFEVQRGLSFGQPDTWYQIALAERDSDALLGDCALHFLADRQVELGFTLSPAHQRQGLMSEATRALLGFLFGSFGTHRVSATADTRNDSCVRLLERLGFRREGHFRENQRFKGEWGDVYLYALLASEWSQSPQSAWIDPTQ